MMHQLNAKNLLTAAAMAGLLVTGLACSKPGHHANTNIELIQDMMVQPALKAQDFEPMAPGEPENTSIASSRLPPVGSVPQGFKVYPYHLNPAEAAKVLKNPLAGNMSPEIIALGRTKFNTYCIVCHGALGHGDGLVAAKMSLKPPPLISDKIIAMPDGGIFHIITDGQGVMSSYAYQLVDERDRWAIVNYVRSLQKLAKGDASAAKQEGK
jgi:mono/diheme cytochrome c family protein